MAESPNNSDLFLAKLGTPINYFEKNKNGFRFSLMTMFDFPDINQPTSRVTLTRSEELRQQSLLFTCRKITQRIPLLSG